jgi:sec-independent protein translocase protein TatA
MIGSGEMVVILGLGVLLFGSKRVPELARSLGLGIREFKRACNGLDEEELDRKPVIIERERRDGDPTDN